MSELHIPDAAYTAMLDAQDDWDDDEILANSIREVAAPVVAAKLRHLAADPPLWLSPGYRIEVRAWLNGLADQLDPNGDAR